MCCLSPRGALQAKPCDDSPLSVLSQDPPLLRPQYAPYPRCKFHRRQCKGRKGRKGGRKGRKGGAEGAQGGARGARRTTGAYPCPLSPKLASATQMAAIGPAQGLCKHAHIPGASPRQRAATGLAPIACATSSTTLGSQTPLRLRHVSLDSPAASLAPHTLPS